MDKNITLEQAIKELEPEIDKILMELGKLKIVNGKKEYSFGSTHVKWSIQKKLLKERYNIDWEIPTEKSSYLTID